MSQDAIGPFVVTANDGRLFHCALESVGRYRHQRWVFRDTLGTEYIGPPRRGERTAEDVRRIVARWWTTRLALGLTAYTSPTMRTRSFTEDA